VPGDWTDGALANAPYRKALLLRLTAWAENYLEAARKAFDYSQPQDAYDTLPSVQTLVPVVAEFPADKVSLGFRSALEDCNQRRAAGDAECKLLPAAMLESPAAL
jgi:hypothetical protein